MYVLFKCTSLYLLFPVYCLLLLSWCLDGVSQFGPIFLSKVWCNESLLKKVRFLEMTLSLQMKRPIADCCSLFPDSHYVFLFIVLITYCRKIYNVPTEQCSFICTGYRFTSMLLRQYRNSQSLPKSPTMPLWSPSWEMHTSAFQSLSKLIITLTQVKSNIDQI